MTTTDVEVYDDSVESESVEQQVLSDKEAKALDKRIRAASDKADKQFKTLDTSIETLGELIRTSIEGKIHVGLGVKSWALWAKDAIRVEVPDRFQRKELVKTLSQGGASQRAIATAFGISQMTVQRDLDGEGADTVLSTDGVERPRNGKVKDEVIDAEVVDAEEVSPDEPMKAVDIVEAFGDEMANLVAAQGELSLLAEEGKWAGARRRVSTAHLNDLGDIITALQVIVDDLMGDGS